MICYLKNSLFRARFSAVSLILLIILPALPGHAHRLVARGVHPLDWHSRQIAGVMSGGFINGGPSGHTEQIEGHHCMVGNSFNIDVLDDYAFDIDETVELEILFDLKSSHPQAELWFDANAPVTPAGGNRLFTGRMQHISLPEMNANRWYRQTVTLPRARFAGLGRMKTDLYIGALLDDWRQSKPLTICDISIKRSYTTSEPDQYGRLHLIVKDENGVQTPVRVGLYDATGKLPLPSDDATTVKWLEDIRKVVDLMPVSGGPWPSKYRRLFYIDGDYRAKLPAGTYQLVVSHGMEYRVVQQSINIKANEDNALAVRLQRWTNMPAKGWYSGDNHMHYGRGHARDDRNILLHTQAEDLHVSSLLQMGNPVTTHYDQYNWGPEAIVGEGPYYLVPGQEDPRTLRVGHTLQLNIPEPVRYQDKYFLYHPVFEKVHSLGGVTGYAHATDYQSKVFNSLGGLALDVPYGLIDVVEVLSGPREQEEKPWFGDLWFDFLNLGYKLSPSAGTDYMDLGKQPGAARSYVYLGKNYSVQSWFDGLQAGRSFATTGPMLQLDINGMGPGEQLDIRSGALLKVAATASVNPDMDSLVRLALYEQGDLITEAWSQDGSETLELNYRATTNRGTWFVLVAYGKGSTQAVTAPIYVSVNDGGICKLAAVPDLVDKMKDGLASMLDERYHENASWGTFEILKDIDPVQRALLKGRIVETTEIYESISDQAKQGKCIN